jgi:hypothetical protein
MGSRHFPRCHPDRRRGVASYVRNCAGLHTRCTHAALNPGYSCCRPLVSRLENFGTRPSLPRRTGGGDVSLCTVAMRCVPSPGSPGEGQDGGVSKLPCRDTRMRPVSYFGFGTEAMRRANPSFSSYREERLHSASVSADMVRPRLRNAATGPTATTSLMHSRSCDSFLARLERPTH